ncbi:MAG TPA: type VI secretion system contractile sheath small subunit [Planctomycetota bacterium]|nr:type VI secretion system contractile sheath small subunit [Planctomycetota bacterium]
MAESYQDRLDRVRKPRVHIKYKVWTGNAEVERELPFVVGVLGDFSGHAADKLPPISERKFVQVDRDNFSDVMARMQPALQLRVKDTLSDDQDAERSVSLQFRSMDDFEPARVAEQVPALKELLRTRAAIKEILSKADLSPELENTLEKILEDPENVKKLQAELGGGGEASDASGESEKAGEE